MPQLRFRHPHLARRLGLDSGNETEPFCAKTLGEAITEAERLLNAHIIPHDEDKWFRIYLNDLPDDKYGLVDIHIWRNGEYFCPKQDTSTALLSNDIIAFETLIC